MSSIVSRTQLATVAALTPAPSAQSSKASSAAKQFEGLLIAQMLRSTHESSADDDSTDSPMIDLAAQQFSQLLANNGGLGLAKLVVKGLQSANQ